MDEKSEISKKFILEEVPLVQLVEKKVKTENEVQMLKNEYAIQKAETAFLISTTSKELTLKELNQLFGRIGFNTKTRFAGLHGANANYIYNIDGFVIPFWEFVTRPIIKISPTLRKTLLTKYSPGKRRYHVRLFRKSDNSWYLIAHVDIFNWISISRKSFEAHYRDAQGDHILGHIILKELMSQVISMQEVENIDVNKIYQDLVLKYLIDKNKKYIIREKKV